MFPVETEVATVLSEKMLAKEKKTALATHNNKTTLAQYFTHVVEKERERVRGIEQKRTNTKNAVK